LDGNDQSANALSVTLRIFISSPGDVAEERQRARDLIERLNKDHLVKGRVELEAVSWDDPDAPTSMPINLTPQQAVNRGLAKPSDCDIVVVLFWNRMGTELDRSEGVKANGEPYRSGTEWELEDALSTPTQPDRPIILLYQRTGFTPDASDPDDPRLKEQLDQRRNVNAFFQELRQKKRFATKVAGADDFERRLENDLKHQISLLLGSPRGSIAQTFQQAPPVVVGDDRLARAEALLASLPLETVARPALLPAGSHMPHARNALFVGREADLKALASALKTGETAAVGQVATVTGLGGIGKTQLASEFVHRYGQYFSGGVFWISFADPDAVPAEIATCGGPGGMALPDDFDRRPIEEQVRLVAAQWQGPLPRLLVFDNCEHEALLQRWRPRTGGCRVLVTSRRETWGSHLGVRPVSLGVLARAESLELLCKHRPDLVRDDPVLDAICEELGDLPLALHLAGSFLARYRHAPSGQPRAYLEAVRRPDLLEHRSLTIEGASPTGHEQHVARTFAMSYDQLKPSDDIDAVALVTLARAAWFAPGEPIPRGLLRASVEVDDTDEAAILRFEDGLTRLRELGLLSEQEGGTLALHRLLAAFVRIAAGDAEAHVGQVEAVVFAEALRLNQGGYPAPLLAWQPQLRFVAEQAAGTDSEHASNLLGNLGYHLRMVADFSGAKAVYERALKIDENSFGLDHPYVARDVNNLGEALYDLGDLTGAKEAFERALKIDENSFGPDHPYVAIDVNNLGEALRNLGDLAGAKAAYERALKIDQASLGPDHPYVAIRVNNLGLVLQNLGDLAGAKAAFERALKIGENSLGPDHPYVAIRLNNLGLVLHDLGDLAGAKAAVERALRIDENSLGRDHPNVAMRVHNLGLVLHDLGDLAGAKAAFERALAIWERALGSDHPNTRTARGNLESLGGD
jgi:tetratricopeptide (TPR) repeat protein